MVDLLYESNTSPSIYAGVLGINTNGIYPNKLNDWFMSPLQKGVKTPGFWFFNHIPALKDGASDLSYVPYNSDSCPSIYAGVIGINTNGIYPNKAH